MLKSLAIKNFAIIDDIVIDFNDKFSVITGETGSGKSVIIQALNLILGSRANTSMVKVGNEKAFLTGVFLINNQVANYLNEVDIDYDDELEISRVLNINGKSTYKVNGQIVPLNIITAIRENLIEIKSQDDNVITNAEVILDLIDQYGEIKNSEYFKTYQSLYNEYVRINKQLGNLNVSVNVEDVEKKLEEIRNLSVGENELEELKHKSNNFQNQVKIVSLNNEIIEHLDTLSEISFKVAKNINELSEYENIDDFKEIDILIQDYRNGFNVEIVDLNEDDLDYIESRIYEITKLFNMYGGSYESLKIEEEKLDELLYIAHHSKELEQKYLEEKLEIENKLNEICIKLLEIRENASKLFATDLESLLSKMYMEDAKIKFEANQCEFYEFGNHKYSMHISTNLNSFSPINQIASGGEKARVILAIKTIISKKQNLSTIIFDEVDTGVSGRVAKAMGEVMQSISANTQVIAITHLPQVASIANHHLQIEKSNDDGKIVNSVNYVSGSDRINAIARMLSGSDITTESIENAKVLLEDVKR